MPLQRLISNGMEWADAHELHGRSEQEPWAAAAKAVADRTMARAESALRLGHTRTALECYLHASAAYRFGQNPLPDGDDKRGLYIELMGAYRKGVELIGGVEHVTIETAQGKLHGWLHRPAQEGDVAGQAPPVVVSLGGFDGWREEYHGGARRLVDEGLAVLLLDGPGQGESRLFEGVYMPPEPEAWSQALSLVITWTQDRAGLGAPAVWGNSMGGYLAARLAAEDPRVRAVCINGGTDRPAEILDRYPRFITKMQALFGTEDPAAAHDLIERQHLTKDQLARITCPALILHGEPDQVFLADSARRVASSLTGDCDLHIWPDGDHCLYNHGYERDALIADWFTDRLLTA